MPNADNDQHEEHDCAGLAEDVDQNLEHRIAILGVSSGVKILNAGKKIKDEELAEDSRAAD